MKRFRAFTIIELVVVVIIVGALAAVAIPRLATSRESAFFSEAVRALQLMYAAEARYAIDHGVFNATCTNLDVDVTPRNFAAPNCNTGSVAGNIGIARSGSSVYSYTLYVSTTGVYTCPSCPASLKKLCPNTACP